MRSRYWSNTKFATWIRGTEKPGAATSKGWSNWKKSAQSAMPYRYWLAEEVLDYLQGFVYYIPDKLNDVRYYINNRWVSRSHSLTAHPRNIKPGQWCDVGNRFLPCLFNELVNFVEIEQAWHHCLWDDEAKTKFKTPWWRKGWLRWRTWRCPEAGLEYLNWASKLVVDDGMGVSKTDPLYGTPTRQATSAKEILALYKWWTVERPARPDPHDASGWTAICETRRQKDPDDWLGWEDETENERKDTTKALNIANQIEKQYDKEDEEMMIRLIKIRDSLWT
jgi:hypothetical protein